MPLSVKAEPVNVRWTAKSLMENPVLVAFRIQNKVQDNSHQTVNGENPDRRDSETESSNFCTETLPKTLLLWTPEPAWMGNLQESVFELPLSAGEVEYVSLSLAKQNRINKQNALCGEQNRIQHFYTTSFTMFRIQSNV